jgi:hypothetical protein
MSNDKFAYVARKPCGCVAGTVHDNRDRRTGEVVADFITEGWTVTRHSRAELMEIFKESTLFNCSHGQLELGLEVTG